MRKLGPLGVLVLCLLAMASMALGYGLIGAPPSGGFQVLLGYGSTLGIGLWMVGDAHWRRRVPCYDFGWLVLIFFPVSLAWYVVSTRGLVRGVGMLLLLAMLWMVPSVCLGIALGLID